jgi:hypothetical protein
MKLLKLITASIFTIAALASCDYQERVVWSPDGERMAVLADQLHVADKESISKPLLTKQFGSVIAVRWLPDNHHALVVYRRSLHHVLKSGSKNSKNSDTSVDYLQIFDFSGAVNEVKAVAGPVLFKSNTAIEDLRLSPNGKLVAISQADKCRHRISIITLGGVASVVASNASEPEWSKDSCSIYFFREISPKNSAYTTFIPVSTISSLAVADASGKLSVSKLRRDLAQCAGDILSGGRIRALEDGSLLFCSTAIKLPSAGAMFGLQERALFRYRPSYRASKPSVEQIKIDGPSLASDLETFEPNQNGSKIAICSSKGAVRLISLSEDGTSGQVTLLEKPLADSAGNFAGCAPRWRNANELTFSVRNASNVQALGDHDGDVVLQDFKGWTPGSELPARQVLSRNWPLANIDFLKLSKPHK